jgi:hypothetical protein
VTRFVRIAALLTPALAGAAGPPHTWRPVPSSLWAVQAFVPPGTTDTRAVQMVPTGVPGVGIPVPVPAGQPGQAGAATRTTPVPAPGLPGAPGRVPQVPPGVPPPGVPNVGGVKPAAGPASPAGSIVGNLPPAVAAKPVCEVTLRLGRMDMAATGGEFLLPASLKPAACPSSVAFAAPWLKMTDQSQLRFVVEPNTTAAVREALILIGGRAFLLRQMPPPQPGLAAAPSRLVFGVNKEGRTDTKVLTAWSERTSGTFVVRAAHPWLQVTPGKAKKERQVYEVTVRSGSGLPPGRHDSQIELVVEGTAKRSLIIPVVVEVEGSFY